MVEQLTPSTKRPYTDISDSDSEWEYEYSTTETESFYVTLDLSSHSNSTLQHPSKRRLKHKTKTGIPANDRPPHPITIDNVEVTAPAPEPPPNLPTSPAPEQPPSPSPDEAPERIQVLDLHSDNPLISYQGAIYSCAWTEPLGTDVLLTAPPDQASGAAPANGKEVSPILAWSRLRLVAKPVKLIPHQQEKRSRKEDLLADGTRIPGTEPTSSRPRNLQERLLSPAPASGTDAQPAAARGSTPAHEPSAPAPALGQPKPTADPQPMDAPSVDIPPPLLDTVPPSASPTTPFPPPPPPTHQPTLELTTSPPPTHPPTTAPSLHTAPNASPPPLPPPLPQIHLPSHASHNRHTQASFLTALMHAKRARNETDTVTLHAPKPQGTGWRAQKKAKERGKKKEEKRARVVLVEEGEEAAQGGREGREESAGMRASQAQRGRGRTRGRGRAARGGRTAMESSRALLTSDGGLAMAQEAAIEEGRRRLGEHRVGGEAPAAMRDADVLMAEATASAEAQTAVVENGGGGAVRGG